MPPENNRIASLRNSALAGVGFIVFGVVALFGVCVLLPLLLLVTPRTRRARRVRGLASVGFRFLIHMIQGFGLARIELEGSETLATEGCLLVANHPSYLDAVFLMAYFPHVNCVMKPALLNHPLFFPFARLGGYIAGSEQNPMALVEDCRAAAQRGDTILIFPEGTRTTPGTPMRFRRGTAQIALRAELPIVPVVIICDPPALTHGCPWYRMPGKRVRLVIRFQPPRAATDFAAAPPSALPRMARQVTRGLENYFITQLASTDHEPPPSLPPLPPAQKGQ
ncbi:MAG: lysophospholipid acyltransferase family protein [Gammaproteobacteria bacterium]